MGALEVFRYERKYVVSESTAVAIRKFITAYLEPDEHMNGDEATGYRVQSLYFDSPQFALYRHSTEGLKNRFKLRIRCYDERADSPAFVEIKKRTTDRIHKVRAAVSKEAADRLLCGARLGSTDLLSNGDASLRALSEFSDQLDRLRAMPTIFVGYRREAYASPAAEGTRVTFDRRIVGYRFENASSLTPPQEEVPLATKGVVLEFKYNGHSTWWMQDLIASFKLQKISFPKYVHCVDAVRDATTTRHFLATSLP